MSWWLAETTSSTSPSHPRRRSARPPRNARLRATMPSANNRVAAGVDLGGTKIQTVVLRDGEVAGSQVRTPRTAVRGLSSRRSSGPSAHHSRGSAGESDLVAVGAGSPGEIDQAERRRVALLAATSRGSASGWIVARSSPKSLAGGRDDSIRPARRVLGEYRRGAGRPDKDVLGVWVGTGVGGGLILDGELRGRLMT